MNQRFKSVGPAIIVAAVVLGPGSILTTAKTGAAFGYPAILAIALACLFMFGMVTMATWVGMAFERTPGEELRARLGRPIAILVGVALFAIVAIFQTGNNLAILAGLEPLFGEGAAMRETPTIKVLFLVTLNGVVILFLYKARQLFKRIERLMKGLVLLMILAFVTNFIALLIQPPTFIPNRQDGAGNRDLLLLIGMVGTTFSVAAAYYQAYLAREKGWNMQNVRSGIQDSALGVTVLFFVTTIILLSSTMMFYGNPQAGKLTNVGQLAAQLEPLFGRGAVFIFAIGILAGALSSFLVNVMVGGTVLSDSLGLGSRMADAWPRHLAVLALLCGCLVACLTQIKGGGVVGLITLAQAITVIGIPSLAFALLFLGTRPDLPASLQPPRWMRALVLIGTFVACALSIRTLVILFG